MKITSKPVELAILTMLMLLMSFGCSETVLQPDDNGNGSGISKVKARKSFLNTVDLSTQTSFKVKGINGVVNVESVSGTNRVTISGEKIVSANTYQDANSHLNDIEIEIDESADELLVKTVHPESSNGRSYVVDYTIKVPDHLNVIVTNVNGEIKGKITLPLNGTVDMSLLNGTVTLEIPQNTSAEFSANLVNGSIAVHNLTLQNEVSTSKSVHGTLADGNGDILLKTTSGNINVLGY